MQTDDDLLKLKIMNSLIEQGFSLNGHIKPDNFSKIYLRKLHEHSKNEQVKLHGKFIQEGFKTVLNYAINGNDIDPDKIDLELIEVKEGTKENIIFKWWNLVWWSVPYQKAYGRQMRFILWDKGHNAPFGLIGLQSPILKMAVRDRYLNIPKEDLDIWINRSMQAQRLGALPPYNQLLGGKMTALSLTSNDIVDTYKKKYENFVTILKNRVLNSDILFITTTSAFGRSSIYNRLKYEDSIVAQRLGFTKGFGTFHISQELYLEILNFLTSNGVQIGTSFGNGPSRKMKLLDIAFSKLDLKEYTFHNISREFFIFPLVSNLNSVIHNNEAPEYYNRTLDELTNYWKERWCKPRSQRDNDWRSFIGADFINEIKNKSLNGE